MSIFQILFIVIGIIVAIVRYLRKQNVTQETSTTVPEQPEFVPPRTTQSFDELLTRLRMEMPDAQIRARELDNTTIDELLNQSNNDLTAALEKAQELHERPKVVASGRFQGYAVKKRKTDPIKKLLRDRKNVKNGIILSEVLNRKHF